MQAGVSVVFDEFDRNQHAYEEARCGTLCVCERVAFGRKPNCTPNHKHGVLAH